MIIVTMRPINAPRRYVVLEAPGWLRSVTIVALILRDKLSMLSPMSASMSATTSTRKVSSPVWPLKTTSTR